MVKGNIDGKKMDSEIDPYIEKKIRRDIVEEAIEIEAQYIDIIDEIIEHVLTERRENVAYDERNKNIEKVPVKLNDFQNTMVKKAYPKKVYPRAGSSA